MTAVAKQHIIHKLSLEINIEGEQQEQSIRGSTMDSIKQTVLTILEELLDELDDGRILRIDQLDIQLEQIDPKRLRQDLRQQIKSKLPEQLREATREDATIKQERSPLDTLEYFLNSGVLPWWDAATDLTRLESEIMQSMDNKPEREIQFRHILIQSNPERIILQLSDDFLKAAFKILEVPEEFWPELRYAQKSLQEYFSPRKIRSYFIRTVLQLLDVQKVPPLRTILKIALLNVQKDAPDLFQKAIKNLKTTSSASAGITKTLLQDWSNPKEAQISKESISAAEPAEKKQIQKTIPEQDGFYIQNAGLVLLHPFIGYLFQELEYTKENRFVDEFHQQQAALVLQNLLDPKGHFPEHELILNKLLCGIELEQPIESKLLLNDAIRTQTEQLLQSTIKHWPALKNTSIDGLRHNFLLREGKLSRKENGEWKLFVEYQTHDVLLAKLNWNYSLVKLPWMNNILWVEWA